MMVEQNVQKVVVAGESMVVIIPVANDGKSLSMCRYITNSVTAYPSTALMNNANLNKGGTI